MGHTRDAGTSGERDTSLSYVRVTVRSRRFAFGLRVFIVNYNLGRTRSPEYELQLELRCVALGWSADGDLCGGAAGRCRVVCGVYIYVICTVFCDISVPFDILNFLLRRP